MKKAVSLFMFLALSALAFSQAPADKVAKGDKGMKAKEQAKKEEKAVTTPSGLKYEDLVVGKGAQPQKGQTVVVHYTGWLTNGKKFDSSLDRKQPFKFKLGEGRVIKGWDEGVATMKVGGKRKLTIPPDLAYGDKGFADLIPAGSTLVFEVELLGIE